MNDQLPPIDDLPEPLRVLAEATLCNPRTTSDHLLVLADACDELERYYRAQLQPGPRYAVHRLADLLREIAPDRAP